MSDAWCCGCRCGCRGGRCGISISGIQETTRDATVRPPQPLSLPGLRPPDLRALRSACTAVVRCPRNRRQAGVGLYQRVATGRFNIREPAAHDRPETESPGCTRPPGQPFRESGAYYPRIPISRRGDKSLCVRARLIASFGRGCCPRSRLHVLHPRQVHHLGFAIEDLRHGEVVIVDDLIRDRAIIAVGQVTRAPVLLTSRPWAHELTAGHAWAEDRTAG